MKYANKKNARYTMVLGEDELAGGKAALKEMATGETREISFRNLEEWSALLK